MITKKCLCCGKEFSVWFAIIKRGGGKYCSWKCFRKSRIGRKTGLIPKSAFKKGHKLGLGKKRPDMIGNTFGFKKGQSPVFGFKKGQIPWNKDKIYPQFSGKNSWNWQGGISFEPYSVDWTDTLRRSIRERDHYICQLCGKEPAVCVHHVDYDKKNCNPINLITLCRACNSKVNFNREYWTNYFYERKN